MNEQEIRELIGGLGPSVRLTSSPPPSARRHKRNPLFVQEVVHHLIHEHALEDQGGYLVAALDSADSGFPTT